MDWFGRASISFTHASSPLTLPAKNSGGSGSSSGSGSGSAPGMDFPQLCRDSTPPCQLNPLLFNGHVQTMWSAVASAAAAPPIHYRRKIFAANHTTYSGTFAVDFAARPHDDADPTLPPRTGYFTEAQLAVVERGSDDHRPMLLVLHGLTGGSYETYLRHCIAPLRAKVEEDDDNDDDDQNWVVAVVNSRGCANSAITSGVLFNARATWDIRQVARWAREKFPNRPLFGLGFSMGANILTNYVGEEGATCPLSAAVVVGNPFDLQISNKALQRTFLGRHIYETFMGSNVKQLMVYHKESFAKYTDLDYDRVMKIRYLYEFDREVQCQTWGYPTEEAYYRDASSCDSLLAIRIPFLAIQAKDDPIAVEEAVPYGEFKNNPYTVLCMTSLGGHLSWMEPGGGRWHAKPVSNFLKKMATEVDLAAIPRNLHPLDKKQPAGASFQPMRRKMVIHIDE
ncbi:alpha beta hydrolase fold family [Niveomyces insectorum RCEF 264]|uniref:alcohol O-acetyltransferase n=1 Tax=Niveomyces insectorum RCEF 264 TaxID=1081102 RepID=A0A167TC76_9HYPO|nr:alpha beta hydrolase fold family [Niveomyces insectorum RCEF 264]